MNFLKTKLPKRKHTGGFTLFEMMTVIGIIFIITGISVADRRGFNQSILLTNLAYDVALSIREAQVYGIAVKGFEENSVTSFDRGYGIHMREEGLDKLITRYFMYVDGSNGNVDAMGRGNKKFEYTVPEDPANDEIIKKEYDFRKGYKLTFCAHERSESNPGLYAHCSNQNPGSQELNITFTRPDPDAYFIGEFTGFPFTNAEVDKIKITITSNTGDTRGILVYSSGQIAVCRTSGC